jgi:uracil-DNA glycosylase
MNQEIQNFVEALATIPSSGNFFNQYSYEVDENSLRRTNLVLYFQQMAKLKPRILLVGEAPGYRGCRLTGVPFTSEFIVLNGIEKLGLFGVARGYQKTSESAKLAKEASASIVWETLLATPSIPLIWNAFGFHPFQGTNQQSNRKPTASELTIGRDFLQQLLQIFAIKTVVAVGNTAQATLNVMQISSLKVRHPAYGGKLEFSNGIKAVMETMMPLSAVNSYGKLEL